MHAPVWRVAIARSARLNGACAVFIGAAAYAAWLTVAPRWGGAAGMAAAFALAAGLLGQAVRRARSRPDGLALWPDGAIERLRGEARPRLGRLAGLTQWPGLLALDLRYADGSAEAVVVLSDAVSAEAYRRLAAWARSHAGRNGTRG
jgi:hypothetical protein